MSIDNDAHLEDILDELKKYGTVTVDKNMCIICVVGDLEWNNIGFESFAAEAFKDIPVRMISYGGSNYNISFLIRGNTYALLLLRCRSVAEDVADHQ